MRRWGAWVLLCATLARAQVITTIAGSDPIFPTNGIPAASAPLRRTTGVAVDASGNVYLSDFNNSIVARVSANGLLTVVAGNGVSGFSGEGGPAVNASLRNPEGVAIDQAGNVYIADLLNYRVRKVSNGIITTVAGTGKTGFSGDGGDAAATNVTATGLAVDAAGNLYIADAGNNRIRKVANGIITTVVGNGKADFSGDGGPAINASLNFPEGIAIDAAGNLYIADYNNQRVRKVSTDGIITTVAGNGNKGFSGDGGNATSASLNIPRSVAVDGAGNLYIADYGNGLIRKVSGGRISTVAGNGTGDFSGDGGPATSAALNGPIGVAADAAGNLYIADSTSARIRKVSGGIITTLAGNGGGFFSGDGGVATAATFGFQQNIALDTDGSLYIADTGNHRIRKLTKGVLTTVAGNGGIGFSGDGGPAASAALNFPQAVAVDGNGNLFIADNHNNRVRKVSKGIITTVAGNGNSATSGDGGPATSAGVSPSGLAVDGAGNLYIAEYFNNRVRKVANGTITTVAGNGSATYSGDGGPATAAGLAPFGIVVDTNGNLYVTDDNNRIRKISNGIITTIAGTGSAGFSGDGGAATNATLRLPRSLALDTAGNLYIGDVGNQRVRRVSNGIITTVAGNGTAGFSGDGGPATSASLNGPNGLAVDAGGNIYISDTSNFRIREVLAAKPSYQAAPTLLSFSAVAGGSLPGAQSIALSSPIAGLSFRASASDTWLSVTPVSGTIPANVQVAADPSSLPAGSYSATVTITVPDAAVPVTTIAVSFTVEAATPPVLALDTQKVNFTAVQGGSAVSQAIQVRNTGGGSLSFTASAETATGGPWLSLAPASGSATALSPVSVSLIATPGTLPAGTYSGTVTITGAGTTLSIPVTLSISAPTATILLSQSALSFTAVSQGGMVLPQNFGILNTGQGSMDWTASTATLSGGPWLQISPTAGTVPRPFLDVSLANVSVNAGALAAGTYYGQIQVAARAVNSPQVITVILTVLPAGSTLGPQVFPAGLIFTGVAGRNSGSQDVQVGNPAGTAVDFLSGIIGTGLDYLPKSATVLPDQPTVLHVYPDFSQLSPGSIQKGTITLQFSDASPPQNISVLTVVAPGDAAGSRLVPHASCTINRVYVVFRTPVQVSFPATVGQSTMLEVQVSDSCGNLVGPDGQSASVQANFGNQVRAPMVHIGSGIWQGSFRPLSAGTFALSVTALLGAPNGSVLGGESTTLTAVVSLPVATPAPAVTAEGVVHAASAVGGLPIAPGGLISIFGQNLSDSVGVSGAVPLPQQLNGTQVMLGNQSLPILYTAPGQLNVQVPYAVPVNTLYQLTVRRGTSFSVPQQLVVAQAEPGIFTVNQQGFGPGSIVKSDGITLAQPGTPAAIGETVVIYCSGLGAVSPRVAEGAAPAGPPNLSAAENQVSVTIGGQPARVDFAGLTPGDPGLYQINAVVPSGIVTGDAVPVVISVAGQTSPINPAVTMAVK